MKSRRLFGDGEAVGTMILQCGAKIDLVRVLNDDGPGGSALLKAKVRVFIVGERTAAE